MFLSRATEETLMKVNVEFDGQFLKYFSNSFHRCLTNLSVVKNAKHCFFEFWNNLPSKLMYGRIDTGKYQKDLKGFKF